MTWINGSNQIQQNAEYGLYGLESDENWPNILNDTSTVVDSNGLFWMFGGQSNGWGFENSCSSLWSYDYQTNQFLYRKGKTFEDLQEFNKGLGVESYRNIPKNVRLASFWSSTNNFLYKFGGSDSSNKAGNDLWKFNVITNNWIKINSGTSDGSGNFGVKGVESISNNPPALVYTTTWTDEMGNLYLFGGKKSIYYNADEYNTVWKYNVSTNMWSWIAGSNQPNVDGVYNLIGTENNLSVPSSREGSCVFKDLQGNIYIYGGYHQTISNGYSLNDMWKFNPTNGLWTWLKGSLTSTGNIVSDVGIENINNMPTPTSYLYDNKKPNNWVDKNGNFWIQVNEYVWRYRPITNSWTVMKKSILTSYSQPPVYGTINVENSDNFPGLRISSGCWTGNDGNLYLYNGNGYENFRYLIDLWRYNISTNNWTFIKGAGSYGGDIYGSKAYQNLAGLIEEENTPGSTDKFGAKWNDNEGNLWLFSVHGSYYGIGSTNQTTTNDLWKFHSSQKKWQWIKGRSRSYNPTNNYNIDFYGDLNIENKENTPFSRLDAMSWVDNNGNLWMFGGQVTAANSYFQDLWMYNKTTNNWVWKGGVKNADFGFNRHANYGTLGVYSPSNIPGARVNGKTWTDAQGNFYLYGGYGFDETSTTEGYLNDVWKFDVSLNQWVWLNGAKTINDFSNNTYPSSDYGAGIGWADENKNFWYFSNNSGNMWKYDTNSNSWSKISIPPPYGHANYGTIGVESNTNFPGTNRNKALTWTGKNGNLWLFGGDSGSQQNLWRFNINTNMWTWMFGPQSASNYNYGEMNVTAPTNLAPYRHYSATWHDVYGNLYFFGGTQTEIYDNLSYNDVWKIDLSGYYLNVFENQNSKSPITIFPNPVKDILTFKTTEKIKKAEIFDTNGRLIKVELGITNNQMNISVLKTGNYIVKFSTDKQSYQTKFIKQ